MNKSIQSNQSAQRSLHRDQSKSPEMSIIKDEFTNNTPAEKMKIFSEME